MLTVANGQFTQVQYSDKQFLHIHLWLASYTLYTLVKRERLIKEGKIPMQELDRQRGGLFSKGAYFRGYGTCTVYVYTIRAQLLHRI